jgi:hypothetical protein
MSPNGFSWQQRKNGDVVISHHGNEVTVLRATKAQRFLDDVEAGDPQDVMARVTGNYKRGNERTASRHPRNSGR